MNENTDQKPEAPDFSHEEMKMPETAMTQRSSHSESSVVNGPLLAVLALLLILILSGMYYWFNIMDAPTAQPTAVRPTAEQNNEPESTTAEAQTETMQAVSSSDEISAIEADLEATNLDSMDSEMQAIDAEMQSEANAQ